MTTTTVAVLRGGPSDEYDISMETGKGVLTALADSVFSVKDIIISRSGDWLVNGFIKDPQKALIGVDVVFIALHGVYGEDGQVQRILDRLSIPYTGSAPYASALAMNKELAKKHLSSIACKHPQHMRLTRDGVTDPMQTALSIGTLFGPEYIIKPTSGGSSLGTHRASNPHELGAVLKSLLQEYDDLLVEEYVQGKEVTVGVLENFRNQTLYDLPVVEIIPPANAGFFSADVKYTGETQEICPARCTKEEKARLSGLAKEIHQQMNLRHYSRSDFIIRGSDIYFLEVNTLPGLTKESLFPKSIDAVGANYKELIQHLIMQASLRTV